MRQSPGAVEKGHPMGGHAGARRTTVQNLKLAGIRPEANVLLVRGSIPGANGTLVVVRKALKKAGRA